MIGYLEAACGIGMIIAPLFGAVLYEIDGYNLIYNGIGVT